MAEPARELGDLSADERLDLIEALWASLDAEAREDLPLTAQQREELQRRLAQPPGPLISPAELRALLHTPS